MARGIGWVALTWMACNGDGAGKAPDSSDTGDTTGPNNGGEPVLIVGAGPAGLAAARALEANGIDAVILEARERVGGRVNTGSVGGVTTDLGASWVHGVTGNPIVTFGEAKGATFRPDDDGKVAVWDEGTGWLERRDAGLLAVAALNFARSADDLRAELGAGQSVGTAIDRWVSNVDAALPDTATQEVRDALARRNRYFARWFAEDAYAGNADLQSLDWFYEDLSLPGGDAIPQGGYSTVIDAMATGLEIRLGEPVTDIAWGDSGVTVTTDAGTYTGRDVIVTVPLGVLKAGTITFDPELPAEKQDAIDRLGFGNYEKVILNFDTNFWSAQGDEIWQISLAASPFPYAVDLTRFSGQPQLAFLSGGAGGGRVGALGTTAVDQAMDVLRKLYGAGIPEPTASKVTDWKGDPWARGSYSFVAVGSSKQDMIELARNEGRLHFAGEHTYYDFHTTVHGAMLSGLREASKIVGSNITEVPTDLTP
jgi:polyamine oxidase